MASRIPGSGPSRVPAASPAEGCRGPVRLERHVEVRTLALVDVMKACSIDLDEVADGRVIPFRTRCAMSNPERANSSHGRRGSDEPHPQSQPQHEVVPYSLGRGQLSAGPSRAENCWCQYGYRMGGTVRSSSRASSSSDRCSQPSGIGVRRILRLRP